MANSTWFEATNEILALSSLPKIANVATFNDEGSKQKYQAVAKQFAKLAHKHLGVRAYNHFNNRKFDFGTVSGTNIYDLDVGLSPENIKLESFFNNTAGNLASQNGPVRFMEYKDFQRRYPDPDNIGIGVPTHWTLLPIDDSEPSPVHTIRIIPDPDNAYTIEYVAKLDSWELTTGDDIILFPKPYEHMLWEFCWELLEIDLGEGKEGKIGFLAREAANQVYLAAGKIPDARKAPRMMRSPAGRANRGYIRSPRSVDFDGTLLE